MNRIFVVSTAVVPPGFKGGLLVLLLPPEEVKELVREAMLEQVEHGTVRVISACGHEATAQFLGVEVSRREISGSNLTYRDRLVGVRPLRRPTPGEELPFTVGGFEGFVLSPLQPSEINV